MRKFMLIAALVLASASAQAGGMRGLTLASNDEPVAAEQAKAAEAPATAEAPKYVDRPAAVSTASEAPKMDAAKPVAVQTPRGEKPKRRHAWTEARIIGELHRHGIYW